MPADPVPAELDEFDPKGMGGAGRGPVRTRNGAVLDPGRDVRRGEDYSRCSQRHGDALAAWFRAHPDVSFLDWINAKRATRRAAG